MASSDRPTPEEINRLMEKLGPEIARRFRAHGLSDAAAAARLETALRELAYRWNRVGDRERWLLQAIAGELPKLSTNPRKEPEHE
ncbi:MAG: hypothetical protein ACJ759_24140 [Thermoanaerobaculia bacterium]